MAGVKPANALESRIFRAVPAPTVTLPVSSKLGLGRMRRPPLAATMGAVLNVPSPMAPLMVKLVFTPRRKVSLTLFRSIARTAVFAVGWSQELSPATLEKETAAAGVAPAEAPSWRYWLGTAKPTAFA